MEYAKDFILNVGYKRFNLVKDNVFKLKNILSRMKEFALFIFCILKKWTSIGIEIIKNNKLISISLFLLVFLVIADFILIDNFMKIFTTLY